MRFFREVLILERSLSLKENTKVWGKTNCETWKLGFGGLIALLMLSNTLG